MNVLQELITVELTKCVSISEGPSAASVLQVIRNEGNSVLVSLPLA